MIPFIIVPVGVMATIIVGLGIGIAIGAFKHSPIFRFFFTIVSLALGLSVYEYHSFKQVKQYSFQTVDVQTGDTNGAKYSFVDYRDYDATPRRPGDKVYTTHKFGGLLPLDIKKVEVTQWYYESPLFYGTVSTEVKVVTE